MDGAVDDAVDNAVDEAAEQANDVVEQQAQDALDEALRQVDQTAATCSAYAGLAEADRSAAMGGVLQAFWFADLDTSTPPADVVSAYVADIDERCAAAPDAVVTTVAREAYDTGEYAPAG